MPVLVRVKVNGIGSPGPALMSADLLNRSSPVPEFSVWVAVVGGIGARTPFCRVVSYPAVAVLLSWAGHRVGAVRAQRRPRLDVDADAGARARSGGREVGAGLDGEARVRGLEGHPESADVGRVDPGRERRVWLAVGMPSIQVPPAQSVVQTST